ncbi:MAG TPA: hypothetical protein PKV72_03530 [Candidatus Peribacteria bacterium]|nr:hypothetical protein [Candidatus Peribacteria bacterium]
MNRAAFAILGTAGLLLAACSSPPSDMPDVPVPPAESGATMSGSGTHPAASVFYRDYAEGDIGNGKPAVLFFAQTGDVFSQRSDRILKHLYGSGAANISTFRLDSGTASGMALRYTVLLPDTFLVVNGSGSKLSSILHPNPSELQKLVIR